MRRNDLKQLWEEMQHGGRLCVVSCAWFCISLQSNENIAAVYFLFCKCDIFSMRSVCL